METRSRSQRGPRISEAEEIRRRYERREASGASLRYSPFDPYVRRVLFERDGAIVRWIQHARLLPVDDKKVLEIGCGGGGNLQRLIQLGFGPENLVGNELLEARAAEARLVLPEATNILVGDAAELDLPDESFDVVLQSTVFSSILDDNFQQRLARRMWSLAKPGGGVLWYDLVRSNPSNADVRGIPVRRVERLFPAGDVMSWRLTLAPPIGRRLAGRTPWLCAILERLPILRTHVLCWIKKP